MKNINIIDKRVIRFGYVLRTITLLTLFLLSIVTNKVWAADIKYHIINNNGKECFVYVIKDGFTYKSIDRNKLCVHSWARSMVAKDFRFYTNKADAVADAARTIGTHFEEGDLISEKAPGTTDFYVRYSMKTKQDLEDEHYLDYDPDGNVVFYIQIRERNDKRNAKRRQVYFDGATQDLRFEFSQPGGYRADIPDENLQRELPYRFRFDPKGDAYGVYIYNGTGEGINPNGVLTVQGVGRNLDNKSKEEIKNIKQKTRVSYENIISDYDPETTTTLQNFFFVAANSDIINNWGATDSWTGKVFLVGALGGHDYYMLDKENPKNGDEIEKNIPYMLCANGDPNNSGVFTDGDYPNGYQLQCFRSWRNMDPSINNTALIKTTPGETTHEVTYHIVNSADKSKDVLTIVQRHGLSSSFNLSNRNKLQRLSCTLSENYYIDRACSVAAPAQVGDVTDVYIPYTFDATGLETATNLVFSTKENPKWFSLTIHESSTKKLVYDGTNNVINSSNDSPITPDAATLATQEAQFAFIGDPYSFQVICKGADGKYAYVNPETLDYNEQKDNVCFTDSPTDTDNMDKFAMLAGTTSSSFQIFQRDAYAMPMRAFWNARGGGTQIWMSAQDDEEIAPESNLHATPTPEYDYTYNIVDNSGHIAIRYTIHQEVAHRLDGEHGHNAIPSAIYSPYLEGETLTFYNSSTIDDENKITQLPVGGVDPTNIYVRYTQTPALLSTRPYPINGTKSYYMKLGDKYVIYDDNNKEVTTQPGSPVFEDPDTKKWVLESNNTTPATPDPYDVRIRNSENDYKLFDNTSTYYTHFIIMNSEAATPAEGQIVLLIANGGDLSNSNSISLALDDESVSTDATDRSAAAQQIVFTEAILKRTYRLIDKQGKILLEYESTELDEEGEGESAFLGVPAKWRSPLIDYTPHNNCGYKYWLLSNFNVSGDTYILKEGKDPITFPAQSNDGYIYVTYDAITNVNDENYVDMNSSVKDIDERVRRSATSANMERDASKFGQLYMLKFTTSAGYYLEDGGEDVETTITPSGTKVYPYTNGDGPLYIYSQAFWDSQKDGGASTRTRWPWYVLSPNNDPYHVMVTSWQSTHSKSDILTSYYNYLRTYYNDDLKQIITGNITDDPRTLDGEGNRIMPTEYMLLGTKDHYKLVTSEEIGTDKSGYETTNHRVVNSFEQYWRNNPAALWKKAKAKKGSDLTQAEKDALLKGQSPLATDDSDLLTNGWHNYKAWVNAAPWEGGSKKYEYDDHWFMTVNVGSGEFELVPAEIDAVLVLVDNHGWEIMRQPIPKHSETARYEAAKTVLRKWDSPMVKQYKFYGTRYVTHKVNGYHKYNIYDNYDKSDGKWLKKSDLVGTGASLADYPEKYSGSALYDLYVNYEVKPEYAQAYTGAATAGATAVNDEFLIRQDGKLAKAADASTLTTIESSSTGIDSGTDEGLSDESLYWYLKPNFDIDKEMGYLYDVREEASDPTSHLYTEAETNERYNDEGASGFDPYNIQIYNKEHTGGYFTTNATAADIVHGQYIATTAPAVDGTVTLSSKTGTEGVFSSQITAYDSKTLKITNQTFMAVQDANGNMRLMPRFDQDHVIQNFTKLTIQAAAQPEDDKAHGQTTWLLRPIVYTYYVIDNQGREALKYKLLSAGAPMIPAMFKSPLAKDFKFYATYGTPGNIETLSNEITGAFANATGLTDKKVYVRYNYNPDTDTDGLLKGMWYNAKLNDADVKVTDGGIAKDTYSADADHRVRFMHKGSDDSDPYAVTLWNGTPATESNDQRYILMKHSSGEGYALMKAANESTTDYLFLDGKDDPTFVAQDGYTTNGTIGPTKKLTLTPVLATNKIIYKVITNTGNVALTSEEIDVVSDVLSLPEWMRSPLMNNDAYIYYSSYKSRTSTDKTTDGYIYELGGEPTTSPKSLDDNVVYVRYDYEKSKKAVESFGIEKEEAYKDKYEGLPYNYAPLDLSGKVAYTIGTTSSGQYLGKLWSVNTNHTIKQENVAVNTELTKEARIWRFTGGDPYEVTIENPLYSTTVGAKRVLAGKEPAPSATWNTAPNDKYPLVQMAKPDDATYKLNTFMVLKYNPNEVTAKKNNVEHSAGSLKLYITGNDQQYLAESNSLAGGVYIYTDEELHYEDRLKASGEPLNPKNETMIIYSSFFYRPVLTYHVITNAGKEALTGYSLMAGTTVEMPEMYQSPLLNSGDFKYYTAATEDAGTWTVATSSETAATTAIADVVAKNKGDIYVRYAYGASPFKIATNIDDKADDNTRLSWIDEKVLDLSGNTFYTVANMQHNFSTDHGRVFGVNTDKKTQFKQKKVTDLPNGRAPSSKEYLWQLEGGDPYAVKIKNAYFNEYLSVSSSDRKQSVQPDESSGYLQTFMILEAHATDNASSRYPKDESGETLYQLQRWTVMMPTGTKQFVSLTNGNSEFVDLTAHNTWEPGNYSEYDIRMSSNEVVTRKIFSMGGGSTADYCVEFIKAPVTRKYRYHAIKFDSEGNEVGETWNAVLEHDWLQPVVIEDVIARQFCKYETKGTIDGDNVTPTNVFETRWTLNQEAQFYHDAAFNERVKDTNSGQYDIYPEIGLDAVYDIYFKYQIDNTATLKERTLSDITSTPEQIAADAAYYNDPNGGNGRMGVGYTQQAKWFFMVLDTDADITATGEGDSRTFTGRQLFLRREDDGTVNWMNNAYALHKNDEDNYNKWSYSRIAEWYQKGDNDAYREGRWLWTFVGDDPYNMRIINFESAIGVKAEGYNVYTLDGAENCYTTITRGTTATGAETYPVTIPTSEPTENQYWGICVGVANSSEETFSLLSTSIINKIDGKDVNEPLYWHMVSRTINKVTTESVEGMLDYVPDQSYAIQLLPYDPVKYQDINLVIKREDHVTAYKTWRKDENWSGMSEYQIRTKKAKQLKKYDSGISLLYFTANERTYVAGDKIDLTKDFSLPLNVRRAFCDYTLYSNDYDTSGGEYTVADGPYPTTTQATSEGSWSGTGTEGDPYVYTPSGDLIYDEDGKPVWVYTSDGTMSGTPAAGAQSIYAMYVVNSDIFLKEAPTKAQVDAMVQNNDHVYFMDFPTLDSKGKELTHHAFYDPEATTRIQTGDLSKNKDKNTGQWTPEKKSWNGSAYVSDMTNSYNAVQYRTADDRLVSTPEKLKWYFVGDPYKVQVFNTAGKWNTASITDQSSKTWEANTKQAQLARFNAVETNFQFVSDCVHIRLPDYTKIDNRDKLIPTNEYGVLMPEQEFPNRNNGKPYINDFYWEVVPTATDKKGTFALRFKEDNELLGYRNVYYYLSRDGLTKTYRSSAETPEVYHINMSYNANNECYENGKYLGYHKANNEYTAIKLIQPVKVYISAIRDADDRYSTSEVTKDEYSGYYGLGETITGIPRHLMRKFVRYKYLTNKNGSTGEHVLSANDAYNVPLADCEDANHSQTINDLMTTPVAKEKLNPIFKFTVKYTVNDLTSEGVHLFTASDNPSSPTSEELNKITWLDMKISNSSWPYYDKTNLDGSGVENKTDVVSNYRRAMYEPKNEGWNSNADGWNDGLKGLHWAFIGDPYDFTILNRRRYEDVGDGSGPMWLAATKRTINNFKDVADSIVWTTTLINAPTATNTSTATASADQNTHWSVQMWKLGGDSDFFLRTASLDKTAYDVSEADAQADNYWRMAARTTTIGGNPYEFEAIPYSLDNKNKWTSNIGDLNYNNYIVNGTGYSKTSSGMGVREQLLQLRTATAKDKDGADNNCFDAKIEIRTKKGDLRISKDRMEVKFGISADMLPYSMRRYGCTYECYINYVDAEHPGKLLYRLRDSNVPMDESESWATSEDEYNALNAAVAAAKEAGQNITLTYVYDISEEVAPYFTTEQSALVDEYTWMNTYFEWPQYYSGTNVEVEYYVEVFDHYVYNAQGQIIDAVYVKERRTKIEKNPTQPYITDAFLNSHTTQTAIYADQSVQTEKDQQKWSLVGDPYSFTMINYDQYLKNQNSKLTLDGYDVVSSNISKQNFAIAVDAEGNTFLSIFDGTGVDGNADVTHCINFDYSTSSDKSLHYESATVIRANDPTGNTLNTKDIKPFKLADLISYADVLQYHLVLAHQYTLEPLDTHLQNLSSSDDTYSDEEKKQRQTLRNHLIEYLKYQGIRKNNTPADSTYYVNYAASPITYSTTHITEDDLKTMLKHNGTLRDFISYPVDDYHVAREGIGNHPQVPWYMKRQFCKYYLYQRDVQRSKVSDRRAYLKNENGDYVDYDGNVVDESQRIPLWMDEEHTIPAYEIDWVSIFDISAWSVWTEGDGDDTKHTVTDDDVTKWGHGLVAGTFRKIPSGYSEAQSLQGQIISTLKDCHKNRKVIIDVVFDVNSNEFNFATMGRNTYAWYQMMTSNASNGLLKFSYKDGVDAHTELSDHYTNEYLWAPEGDPYGFVLHSRYANNNGTGWNDVVVTTTGQLPKKDNYTTYDEAAIIAERPDAYDATYTGSGNLVSNIRFDNKQIIHHRNGEGVATSDGAVNAIYEMFTGDASFTNSYLMHPTSAYIDHSNIDFNSYYMIHDTGSNTAKLVARSGRLLKTDVNANWRLATTPEQLWPYFEHAGYVGGLDPVKAQNFSNLELRTQIKEYLDNPSMEREYTVLNKARQLVYSGNFYRNGETTPMAATDPRPTDPAKLPLRFVADNLVPMTAGYYRIQGFSTEKLKAAETGEGVYGPRYVSGYRFVSEVTNSKPLHYFETNQESTTKHTFSTLTGFSDGTLQGNIELLPAEYDASSIFQFKAAGDAFNRWTFGSQDLNVQVAGTPAVGTPAATKMSSEEGTKFYLDDIGGATVTLRTLIDDGPSNADSDHNWETDADYGVIRNIRTNYLTSNGSNNSNAYSLTVAANNELNQTETTDIQDTKWRLQPVGVRTDWPYNQMPLRVEVKKGGVDKNGAEDKFYYGSLYVPFDSRLGNTTDAAFTMVRDIEGTSGTITMPSVSQFNGMGNPQYIPATWPVVIRTNKAGNWSEGSKHYVDLYLPYTTPQAVSKADLNDKLKGEYLERTLDNTYMSEVESKTIMVFGLPFASHATDHHVYDNTKRVGWFTNDNWARETYPADYNATDATDDQRNNKYVMHNKVYYVHTIPSPVKRMAHVVAIFDGDEMLESLDEFEDSEESEESEETQQSSDPWPCDVFDLQGRRVAVNETPQTLRHNHPGLPKGVYIFGRKKVIVK